MARISLRGGERGNSAGADFAGIVGTYGKTAVTTEERCHPSGGGRRERFYVNRVIPVATVFYGEIAETSVAVYGVAGECECAGGTGSAAGSA